MSIWLVAPALLVLAASCSSPRVDHASHASHGSAPVAGAPVLYDSLGTYSYRITTTSPHAQRWFDQGLRLVYAFNHHEAQRAFREAARLDREKRALEAVRQAQRLAGGARPAERALIQALAKRHSADPTATRETLDRAYADAMRDVARQFPDDLEAATFFADAMMLLRPWDLWAPDGAPHLGTEEIVQTLERALAKNPSHAGTIHLYIHAVEASTQPGRAEAAADRLTKLVPGAGHLVHMPSHIYWRVGRYADALSSNVAAVEADRAYFKTAQPSPIYGGGYYPHNIDFIWQSAAMQGRSADTLKAAREFAAAVPADMIKAMPDMETAPVAPIVSLVRFGRWDDVLRVPAPPTEWPYVTGVWHYARGLAFNGKGRGTDAVDELRRLEGVLAAVPAERTTGSFFRTKNLLQMAANVLAGEIAAKNGEGEIAERLLRAAVAEQDTHWFTEPPVWYFSVRQTLGAVLLELKRPADAEQVYRDDLRRHPDNGWSLFGLARSLTAQGKTAEATQVEARFRTAWSRADVVLSASRF